jgi:hypothetical protein
MGKGEEGLLKRPLSSDVKYRRNDERTVFGHRSSIKGDLCCIEAKGKKYGNFHSLEQPNVDTVYLLPTSQGRETRKCHQTDESVDLYARVLRPILVDDGIDDESKSIEKIDKR